ncbi:hypothetical protein GY14_32255 [Delftia tsuruhatensis]|nr:hypothetical protein GY14_32255 [Delftia tsuruhatensis]
MVGFTLASQVPRVSRSSFANVEYGLLFGDGQVNVRHAGVTLQRVGSMTGNDTVRAQVGGGRIEWFLNDVSVYKGRFAMAGPYVLDAVLYAGDDVVDAPRLQDGVAEQDGTAMLMLAPCRRRARPWNPWGFSWPWRRWTCSLRTGRWPRSRRGCSPCAWPATPSRVARCGWPAPGPGIGRPQ